jgi:hypothetical protein
MFQFFIIKMFKHLQRLLNFARNAGAGFSPFRRKKVVQSNLIKDGKTARPEDCKTKKPL